MAISGTYKELADGYTRTTTADGITQTRKFHDHTDEDGELPEVGDSDSEIANLKVISIDETYFERDARYKLYVVNYETINLDGVGEYEEDESPDTLPINGNLSGELLAIDGKNSGYTWVSDSAAIDQTVFKKNITGAFTITRKVKKLLPNVWITYNGRINSLSFKRLAASFVLFEGCSWEEYFNDKGEKRWKVDFNFSIKASWDDTNSEWRGWNYLYREASNTWDYTSPVLYLTADFNKLLIDEAL